MSLDDVLGQLRDGLQQLETGTAALEGAVAKAEQLSQQFGQLGADGQTARMAEVRQLLESARAKLNLQTPREAEHLIWQATGQQGQATVGDPVTEPRGESAPGSFRQELNSTDDGDKGLKRWDRMGRRFSRNATDVEKAAASQAEAGEATLKGFEPTPPPGQTTATVGVPTSSPTIGPQVADTPGVPDIVAPLVLAAAVSFQAAGRLSKRRREKRHE